MWSSANIPRRTLTSCKAVCLTVIDDGTKSDTQKAARLFEKGGPKNESKDNWGRATTTPKRNRNASVPGKIEPVYRQIGARVRRLRENLQLSQSELAARIGYQRPTLVNFENGRKRISMHRLEKIALALGITPKGLMKGIWW
jgi:ribosome-binding protein aMBF1 (putative translation factor)